MIMHMTFPESSVIQAYLHDEHENTKNSYYYKEMGILDLAAEVFGHLSIEPRNVPTRVGQIFSEKKCLMPHSWLEKSIHEVS